MKTMTFVIILFPDKSPQEKWKIAVAAVILDLQKVLPTIVYLNTHSEYTGI